MKTSAALSLTLLSACFHGYGHGEVIDAPTTSQDGGLPATGASSLDGGVTLSTKLGSLRGKRIGDSEAYLGIPYGQPPVGKLRFMPAKPAAKWTGTLDATSFGDSCVQPAGALSATNTQSEDCLSLNVHTPSKGKDLPVMVWIHGGAYFAGGSSQYDGARLARENGVVVVTINYRLGALGFLSLPALDDERGGVPSGNDGLRDQQLALRWVQDHIAEFRGDPANVTVFGESAGGSSTCLHYVSPGAAGLAARYIVESGPCTSAGLLGKQATAVANSEALGAELCAGEDDVLACLREKDPTEVVAWGSDRGTFGAGWFPVVIAGDDVLPESPAALIAAGKQNPGELLIGTNKNEWALFTNLQGLKIDSVAALNTEIDKQFTSTAAAIPAIKAHYKATDASAADTFVRIVTDAVFRCPTRALVRATSAAGTTTYLYSFEQGAAFHAYEIPYVFGNASAALGISTVDPLHGVIAGYWTSFAKTGAPDADATVAWPPYQADGDSHLVLAEAPEVASGLSKADCDFWDTLLAAAK
jgi:para-nitrobenzyl esterase